MGVYIYTSQWSPYPAHVPSRTEINNLKSIMDWLNFTTWSDYSEKLHMPFTWSRSWYDATTWTEELQIIYWTSSTDGVYSYDFSLTKNEDMYIGSGIRNSWKSIRTFLDEYVTPDNTRTVETWTLWSAWIFHNETLGVISVTNGNDKNITMCDKNVGATVLYNSWDTLSEDNCGKLFQRWNYYWFPYSWTISNVSSTRVDTTWYGWSNPYSSDTFITLSWSPYDWSDPSNNNLRADSKEEYFVIN